MENITIINGMKYATNDNGTGLFVWKALPGQISPTWVQLKGTCDFSVRGLKHPKEKIKRAVNGS